MAADKNIPIPPTQEEAERIQEKEKVLRPTKEDTLRFQRKEMAKRFKTTPKLGIILEEAGLINEQMISELLARGNESAQSLKQTLIQQGLVSEEEILDAIAQEMGLEKVDLSKVKVDKELLSQIEPKIAIKYKVFPVKADEESIHIALADPLDIQTLDDLEKILRKKVIGCVAPEEDILRLIRRYYEGDKVETLYEQLTKEEEEEFSPFRKYEELDLSESSEEQPVVVKFVDLIFKQAVHDRASDIHIEPQRYGVTIRFRIDGVLHEVPSPPKRWQNAIISRLKVLAGMDLAEKRVPQDGRIKLNLGNKKLDLRVSALPGIYGESIVMRILDQEAMLLGLEEVGFLEDNIKIFKRLIRYPNGIILMTGPTGSGKTTTLYAALQTLNTPDTKIITIENPVEYQIEGINQIQVNEEIGLDFAKGLRHMLRQSPDVILVGEIRDTETAEIAIRAALTGHLVFSTLHTNDAPSATIRLIDMGIKPFLVASSIQAVIAQRLVRRICPYCKAPYTPSAEELMEVGVNPDDYKDTTFYKGKGCERCNGSGYRGRTAIHEIFIMSPTTRQMVIRLESAMRIKQVAIKEGMRTLRQDGWQKVLRGDTTIEEVMRVTQADFA